MEASNNKAMREALKLCVDEMCDRCRELAAARGNPLPCLSGCEPVRKAKFALAKPVRNCDAGTADDWVLRFNTVCERCSGSDCDHRLFKDEEVCDCFARWLQMPCKEGAAS